MPEPGLFGSILRIWGGVEKSRQLHLERVKIRDQPLAKTYPCDGHASSTSGLLPKYPALVLSAGRSVFREGSGSSPVAETPTLLLSLKVARKRCERGLDELADAFFTRRLHCFGEMPLRRGKDILHGAGSLVVLPNLEPCEKKHPIPAEGKPVAAIPRPTGPGQLRRLNVFSVQLHVPGNLQLGWSHRGLTSREPHNRRLRQLSVDSSSDTRPERTAVEVNVPQGRKHGLSRSKRRAFTSSSLSGPSAQLHGDADRGGIRRV